MIQVWRVECTYNQHVGKCVTESGLSILYQAPDQPRAIWDGLRWVKNRRDALGILQVTSINISPYVIGEADATGYIKTGVHGWACFTGFEWKYDTHVHTFEELFEDYAPIPKEDLCHRTEKP